MKHFSEIRNNKTTYILLFGLLAALVFLGGKTVLAQWSQSGSHTIITSGNVGIGTTNPNHRLVIEDGSGSNLQLSRAGFGSYNVQISGGSPDSLLMQFQANSAGGGYSFSTRNSNGTALSDVMRINRDGNVGIGTDSPTERLHVVGNVKVVGNLDVSGNVAAKYQDVAEWVPSVRPLPAGTVVTLDEEISNTVTASLRAYDTKVAGVVSPQPGVVLGEPGPNKVLVATTGRVKVRVTAANGSIRIGDLLVTSDQTGAAMRSISLEVGGASLHRPGTILGKALESLENGEGKILVLLSLQ